MYVYTINFACIDPNINSAGASIELTLRSGPVRVDGLAELVCSVTGDVVVHNFTWYHNGRIRMERPTPYIDIRQDVNVGVLSMHDVRVEEAGNYTCVAYTLNATTPLQDSFMLNIQGMYVCS